MTVEGAIIARLKSLSTVTALVSTRVWMLKLPQKPTLRAIRVQLISESTTYSHDGRDRVVTSRVQVDSYAQESSGSDPYAGATEVADAVYGDGSRTAATGLDGYQGDIGSPPFRIRSIQRASRTSEYEPGELRLVKIRQDYMVSFYA